MAGWLTDGSSVILAVDALGVREPVSQKNKQTGTHKYTTAELHITWGLRSVDGA
jgi:hypothetical protein